MIEVETEHFCVQLLALSLHGVFENDESQIFVESLFFDWERIEAFFFLFKTNYSSPNDLNLSFAPQHSLVFQRLHGSLVESVNAIVLV